MVTTAPATIEQAAALLGVSASTIRRRIKAGTLQVEEARRPQGVVRLVHLPAGTAAAGQTATVDTAPVATTATVLGPLVAELAASRQANERQADALRELERENGRQAAELERAASTAVALSAENDRLRAAHSPAASNLTPDVPPPIVDAPVPLLTSLRYPSPIALLIALAIVAVGVLLLWSW